MKKFFIGFGTILLIVLVLFVSWYSNKQKETREVKKYNLEYDSYIGKETNGVYLTTIINKALDNNEQHKIQRNENGAYINDNEYYTQIQIKLDEKGDVFLMEAFEKVGVTTFTELYGRFEFKCTNIKYHENGRIAQINYERIK